MNVSDLSDIDERILMDGKVNFAKAATSEAAPVAEHHEQRDNDAVAPIPATTPTEPQSSAQHEDNNGSKTGHRPPKRFCRRSPEPGPTTTDSNPSPESPELNNANNAISTEANIEYKPAPTETPTDSCGDGKPPVKDRPRRNRRSPKRDAEDTFRVNMGMLPHSRSTETVTDDMREMLRQGFDMLDPVHRVEFGQCLHSSIPDSARVSLVYFALEIGWECDANTERS